MCNGGGEGWRGLMVEAVAAAAVYGANPSTHGGQPPLVDETLHPIEQIAALEERAVEHQGLGDLDGVIEVCIKQLALHKMLVYLYDFPLPDLVRAHVALAEAYAAGRYFKQGVEQIRKGREVTENGIYDDAQCQRLEVELQISEGCAQLEANNADMAYQTLTEALRLCRVVYGDMDLRCARAHEMLGRIASLRGEYDIALDHVSSAWEAREHLLGSESELTIRLWIQMAQVHYMDGNLDEALRLQTISMQQLLTMNQFPQLAIEASTRLAKWQEEAGKDQDALQSLMDAEKAIMDNLGRDDVRTVEVKRDLALLHLKLGKPETALQYLWDVQYLERKMYGAQSVAVARTLKALGTVHMVRKNYPDAEQCLMQALHIFEANQSSVDVVRDIHAKLSHVQGQAVPRM